MKKILVLIIAGLLLLFLLLPFLFLFPKDLAYFAYKEVFYQRVSDDVVKAEKKPEQIAALLNDYIFRNLYTPRCVPSADLDVYHSFISGVAFCDQRAWAMATLLGQQGIDSRMVMIRNPEQISNHTILEVRIDGKLAAFDPFFGINFNKGDPFFTYKDICANPSLFFSNGIIGHFKQIDSASFERTNTFFSENIYYTPAAIPKYYIYLHRPNDVKRFVVTKVLAIYNGLFGSHFSNRFQDAYIALYLNSPENYLEVARNYAFFQRTDLALEAYKKTIAYPHAVAEREQALFFLGAYAYQVHEEDLSTHTLDKLIDQYPETHWKALAHYYKGLDFTIQGDKINARQSFLHAFDLAKEKILSPTKMLCVEALN